MPLLPKRVLLPVIFLCLCVAIFIVSRPQLQELPFPYQSKISPEEAALAVEKVKETPDAVEAAEIKSSADPCLDFELTDGGASSHPGRGQTAMVTGGAGFIGSNLVDRLLALGYKVRIFDNLYTGFLRNVPLNDSRVEFVLGDILDQDALAKAVDGVDYIYHLAAMSKVVPSLKSSDMARFCTESNALGSWNVLDAARKQGESIKKVIYAASSTYYGNQPAPHSEAMAPDFLTPYAASKYEGEIQMQMFDRLFHVPTVSTRFFMVYGPRQPSTGAYAIVTGVFAKQAADDKPLTIEGDGTHYRDFIHVTDIVEGLILSQQNTQLRGDVVNLGSGTYWSVHDVADLVSSNQVHVAPRPNDLEGTLADTCKMKRLLNYKTKADFKTEMSFMAKETMKGNVFMQPWLTPMHALSAPHLLAPDSPVFSWPKSHTDLDALLVALENVEKLAASSEGSKAAASSTRRVSVIMFSAKGDDTEAAVEIKSDLLLNTVFSLVRFGQAKQYMIAATDEKALQQCISLNLPCFDSQKLSARELMHELLGKKVDVHLARLGNSYVASIDGAVNKLFESDVDVVGASQSGDVFVRASERTRSAIGSWADSYGAKVGLSASDDVIYNVESWPSTLDLKKATFEAEAQCVAASSSSSSSSSSGKATSNNPTTDLRTKKSTTSSTTDNNENEKRALFESGSKAGGARSFCKSGKTFYLAPTTDCSASSSSSSSNSTPKAEEMVTVLKEMGAHAWHLTECHDVKHCDRQQTVPRRWVALPTPDLAVTGGIC